MSWRGERLVIPGTPEFILTVKADTGCIQDLRRY